MWRGIDQSPTPPVLNFFYSNQWGGGGGDMGPSALSYASDSGAAKICQQGAKARERSDRAGGGCGRGGGGSPSHDREIFWKFGYKNGIFLHIKCHY